VPPLSKLRELLPVLALAGVLTTGSSARALTPGAPLGSPPLPEPGETVHWTLDLSPISISSNLEIAAGGTVVVDPAVVVQIGSGVQFLVLGTLDVREGTAFDIAASGVLRVLGSASFQGTPAQPAVVQGGASALSPRVEAILGGLVTLDQVAADIHFYCRDAAAIAVSNSTFTGTAPPTGPIGFQSVAGVSTARGTLAVRSSSFLDATIEAQDGYLLVDDLTLSASRIKTDRYRAGQPILFDRLQANDLFVDAPFQLAGFDHFFGAGNLISSNLYPIHLEGGGLWPGSTVPDTGNLNNLVHAGNANTIGKVTFADVAVPYQFLYDTIDPHVGGQVTIEPGADLRFQAGTGLLALVGARIVARGTPDRPIKLRGISPGALWSGVGFNSNRTRPKLEYCIIEDANIGVGSSDTVTRIENCEIRNNDRGARSSNFGTIHARGTLFAGNAAGVQTSPGSGGGFNAGQANLNGETNPNAFVGNGFGLQVLNELITQPDARFNWWGDPTGPTHPANPGGSGDSASSSADVLPFRTAPPDFADRPPFVRISEPYFLLEEGRKVVLRWTVDEDHAIATQRILYSPHHENPALVVLVDDLPPAQRSIMVTIPQAPPSANLNPSMFRVSAFDDAGQEGWDDVLFATPFEDFTGTVLPDPMPALLRPGQQAPVCWQVVAPANGTIDAWLFLDGDEQAYSLGGAHTGVDCLSLDFTAPGVSTDTARVGLRYNQGAGGRYRWEFTPEFEIRPDPALGDEPPSIALLTPLDGQVFSGGTAIPVTWNATDDEQVRSVGVQASYDGGRTWHYVVRDLPGATTQFDWPVPFDAALPQVRLRVVARDLRFQSSSAGADRVITVVPEGSAPDIAVSLEPVDFGTVPVGAVASATLTVSNLGSAELLIGAIAAPAPPFAVSTDGCSATGLAPGASCDVELTFSPQVPGPGTANLEIPSNDPDRPLLAVGLFGEGAGPSNGIYLDGFESGDTSAWSSTTP